MLGLPTNNSFIELRPESDYEVVSHGVFVHDDWRVSDRLTLNLGVRYDLELGMTEARTGTRAASTSPRGARSRPRPPARYAAAPPAGVPLTAQQFAARVVGGYAFLSDAEPQVWDADRNNVQPRIGVTYKVAQQGRPPRRLRRLRGAVPDPGRARA